MPGIDEILRCGRRGLRTRPGTLLLGSTGARLWADYLDEVPGFSGAIDFIHKINMPRLFTISNSSGISAPPAEIEWRPSHLTVRQDYSGLRLVERKFITWDDCAVSVQSWLNETNSPVQLQLRLDAREWSIERLGFRLRMAIACSDDRVRGGLRLAPGERADFAIAAAVGTEPIAELVVRARQFATPEALSRQVAEYERWFASVPRFESSDPLLDRTWWYRWFLLRHNLARPGTGQLPGTVVYEGRAHKMTKTPWQPRGWEFSKLIPLSSPMHLLEARWFGDPRLGAEILGSAAAAQGEDGLLYSRTINETFSHYCNFLGHAAAEYAAVHGIDPVLATLPALKKLVRTERDLRTPAADGLPVQPVHKRTGKEYQPSYWYFHGFPDDPKDPATYTPLKRVDQAIYQHLNASGVARLCARADDGDAAEFSAIALQTAGAVLSKQWDPATAFFYDLHHETDEKALVRNVVGLYPWWAGITGDADAFEKAFAADCFGTPWPLSSVAADCPVFAPSGGWKGRYIKGRNGCVWDGPTWPYTNSVALDAVGRMSQAHGHRFDGLFADLLRKYCLLHFQQHDGRTPYLVEHYDSLTGEPLSDEPDYFHSYLIDLIIRYVAGLRVTDDGVSVDPVDIGLDHFTLDNVHVGGREIAISYDRSSGATLHT